MKKVFCILSVLTISSPAFADVVEGTPSHANSATFALDGNNATIQPAYALETELNTDSTTPASAKYVKGAYNAAIKAVNTVADSIPTSEPATTPSGRAAIWVE